ncbi:HNH endonuclease [Moraxella osloensis]|uniref:HNH endonuclease n=1 Tax=Faucicola osloensis TaxID=34062 RepID=A0AA91FK60_FAUOS|nr:HNH endonuclease [Moraxella osloensis]OBX65787.1 HNH endonuclease [Moraxella osloensis]
MINLTPYNLKSEDFLRKVVESKKKGKNENPPFYKDRIIPLSQKLSSSYLVYDNAFSNNSLHTIAPNNSFTLAEKVDLIRLYKYGSKPFILLKNAITSRPNNREDHTCQYCTINSVNTLDHIMPKDDYPEFAVHPKNLVPACSQCNSSKSIKWITNGVFECLNPYLHQLSSIQFLFVKLAYQKDTFNIEFYLDNKNNALPPYLFNVVENHFRNLNLLDRYKKASYKIISEFDNTIQGSLVTQSLDNALIGARRTVQLNQVEFGYNQFKNVLELELCNGSAYRQYCQAQGY